MKRGPAIALVLAGSLAACTAKPDKKTAPAKVDGARPEAELATVTLTGEAEQRLGLALANVERRTVPHVRTVGGTVEAPPGRSLPITAPLAGTVLAPEGGAVPVAGLSALVAISLATRWQSARPFAGKRPNGRSRGSGLVAGGPAR